MEDYRAAKTYKAQEALHKRATEIVELQEELTNAIESYHDACGTHTEAETNLAIAASHLKKWTEQVAEATKLLEMAALDLAARDKVVMEASACLDRALAKAIQ